MSLSSDYDLDLADVLFIDGELARPLTVDGTEVIGEWETESNPGGGQHGPTFRCSTAALPAGLDRDSVITEGATTYRLESFEHDGYGVSLLVLRATS